jgi:hypothetical protein
MKLNTRILSSALCSGLLLSFSPAIFAEEVAAPEIAICPSVEIPEVAEPEIIICPGVEIPEVAEPEIIICPGVINIDGVELKGDDEVEIIDEETTTDEEVVIDKEIDGEVTVDDGEVIGLNPDWVKRGEGGEEIYYMTGGGPSVEPNRNNASDTARVEADKDAAVTTRAEKSPKVNTVQRNSAKPNAVKSNGRVFLRK